VDEVEKVELGEVVLLTLLDIVLNMGAVEVVVPKGAAVAAPAVEDMVAVPYLVLVAVGVEVLELVMEEVGERGELGK
jgi:hypothetical protein